MVGLHTDGDHSWNPYMKPVLTCDYGDRKISGIFVACPLPNVNLLDDSSSWISAGGLLEDGINTAIHEYTHTYQYRYVCMYVCMCVCVCACVCEVILSRV